MRNELTRTNSRESDKARLASKMYRITWNLDSKTIVTMNKKLPGRPIALKSA